MTETVAHRAWALLAACLAASLLFFFANRAAYRGYFSDDDLDNLGWPTYVGNDVYYRALLTPKLDKLNFRPVGDLYYRYLYRAFHLNFPPYVIALQLVHGLNVTLLFLLLRRLDFSTLAAASGALFYLFHAVVLEIYWKPMYVFDLLCATLCLTTLLLYVEGHWILALAPFWLAYKSKEVAVMLPAGLLVWEWLLGKRAWKRLIPYFAISLSFGLQAVWHNQNIPAGNNYALHLTFASLWHSIGFYSSAVFYLPFGALALLLTPVFVRDGRLYLGLVLMSALLLPMLALPGRQESVYWYVPMIGLAILIATIASRAPSWAIALFFAVWLPWNYIVLREKRRSILAAADENRWYTTGLIEYARRVPPVKAVVFEGIPEHMRDWGVRGAIHQAFGQQVDAVWYQDARAHEAMAKLPMAVVSYYPVPRIVKGMLRTRNELQSYIRFSDQVPKSQLGTGFQIDDQSDQSQIEPHAEITLFRPPESREFEIVASRRPSGNLPHDHARISVFEDEFALGEQDLSNLASQRLRWQLPDAASGHKKITIAINPPEQTIALRAIGYVEP